MTSAKFLLEIGWKRNDSSLETFCYDRMTLCEYYQGNTEKAKYYFHKKL